MPNISVIFDENDLREQLQAWVDVNPRLRPVEFGSDSEYAFSTEFGSDGIAGQTRSGRKEKSDQRQKIQNEIARKYGLTGTKLEDTAKAVYRSRVAFGQIPDPYFRPAVHQVLNEVIHEPDWMSNHSTLDLAERILERMRRILEENRTLFSDDIMNHAFAGYEGETGKHSVSMARVSPEARDSDTSKADGSIYNGHKGIQEGRL